MFFFKFKALFASFIVFDAVNGHIVMRTPIPYGTPDTSPLEASGSNYPCKLDQVQEFNSSNVTPLKVGSSFEVSFSGTAVHNGGSCQFGLTKDLQPSKSSDFRVIMSILGGCPGLNAQTNKYNIPLPSEIPSGNYSLAWSWWNNVGNREMYQDCSPVSVEGGSATQSDFESLPPMALYNLDDFNSCKTIETYDVDFPNPGKYVIKGSGFKPMAPSGCGSKTGTDIDAGASGRSGSSGNSTGSSGSASSATRASSTYTSTSSTTVMSTVYATSGSVESTVTEASQQTAATVPPYANTTTSAGSAPTTLATSASPAGAAPSAPAAGSNGTSGLGPTQSCGSDGAVVCSSDGTQFGLCNFGVAIMQPVAAGTKCSGGQIVKRSAKFGLL